MIERFRLEDTAMFRSIQILCLFFSFSRNPEVSGRNPDKSGRKGFWRLGEKLKSFRVVIKNLRRNEFYLFVVTDCKSAVSGISNQLFLVYFENLPASNFPL